jgi:hypothetical protein
VVIADLFADRVTAATAELKKLGLDRRHQLDVTKSPTSKPRRGSPTMAGSISWSTMPAWPRATCAPRTPATRIGASTWM